MRGSGGDGIGFWHDIMWAKQNQGSLSIAERGWLKVACARPAPCQRCAKSIPLLGCLVTAESANDAAPSVMPWLRVAKGQRYAVSAGNVEMMELVAGGFCLKVATASSHARRSGLGRKSLKRFSAVLWITLLSPAETLLCALLCCRRRLAP